MITVAATPPAQTATKPDPMWELLLVSWDRSLEAAGKGKETRRIYLNAGRLFVAWLLALPAAPGAGEVDASGRPRLARPADATQVSRHHVEQFLVDFRTQPSARRPQGRGQAYANQVFRALQRWFVWMIDEEEVAFSPLQRMKAPKVDEQIKTLLTDDEVRAMLATCKPPAKVGKPKLDARRLFVARRDEAVIRMFLDLGARRAEVAGLAAGHVDLALKTAYVVGKGHRPRVPAFGNTTALALGRYLRLRARQPVDDDVTGLWLDAAGRTCMTASGIAQMVERRGLLIGRPGTHPHEFRHKLADDWLDAGGDPGALMTHAGWTSREMLDRYGAAGKRRRAHNAHARLGLADRF